MWCFTLNTFFSNDWTVRLGQVLFEYNFYPFFSIVGKTLYTLRALLLPPSSNDVSADTAMMKILLSFLLKLCSHHPPTFTSLLQPTLKQHRAWHNYLAQLFPKHFEILNFLMLFKQCNAQAFFGKEGTEEHDFLVAFNDYRIKLFFASLDLTINKRSGQLFEQFASTYWCCGEFQSFLVIVSRSCRALQNRFWTSCGWAWPFRFLQCQISRHETQFTTWCFKL